MQTFILKHHTLEDCHERKACKMYQMQWCRLIKTKQVQSDPDPLRISSFFVHVAMENYFIFIL